MAYTFNGSNQYIEGTQGVVAGGVTPVTLACWVNPSSSGSIVNALEMGRQATGSNSSRMSVGISSGTQVNASCSDESSTTSGQTSTTTSTGVWQHICGVFASSTSRSAYLNGGGKGTDTTSRTPNSTLDRTRVGCRCSSGSLAGFFPGSIAEAAIWNVALSDAEVALLAKGLCPLLMRPQNIVFYMPLIRDLVNLKAIGTPSAVNSPTVANHPRIIYSL